MTLFLVSWLSDAAVYFGVALGLWLSFRVLSYPDLSVEYLFVLGGAILASVLSAGYSPALVPFLLVLVSLLLGFLVSILRNLARVHPILISLSAGYLYYSVVLVLLRGPNRFFAELRPGWGLAGVGAIAGAIFLSCCLALTIFSRTDPGLKVLASGANPQLATRVGLSTTLWQALGLSLSFLLVMTSGVLFSWRARSVDVSHGSGLLLIAIFVVVLSRALQERVRFTTNSAVLLGALLGYLLAMQAVLQAGLPPNWLRGINGAALLLLVLLLPRKEAQLLKV